MPAVFVHQDIRASRALPIFSEILGGIEPRSISRCPSSVKTTKFLINL